MAPYRRRALAGEAATSSSMAATSAPLASPILPQTAAAEETESDLDGETQELDERDRLDPEAEHRITIGGETEAMEDVLEGSERTAVLGDDEENLDDVSTPCPTKRSFTEVRTASLRASGLAAARKVHVARNFTGGDEGSSNVSHAARKLNFEEEASGNRMPKSSVSADESIAGLSYICSQDLGENLQADALEAVDKFLQVNDVGLSQDFHRGKSFDQRKSPVRSSAGAQVLLRKNAPGSPVAKARVFDWIDSLEDDGGGDFFTKSRDLLFANTEQHFKNRNSSLKRSRVVDGSEGRRRIRLSFSEPRLKKQMPGRHAGEVDVERREQDSLDIGQDTQIAAEAMEALCGGPPRNHGTLSCKTEAGVRRSTRLKTPDDASVQGKRSVERKSRKRRKNARVEHEDDHLGIKCSEVPTLGGSSGGSLVAHRTRNSKANSGSRLGKQSAVYEISEKAGNAKRKRSNKTAEISKETADGRLQEIPALREEPSDKMDQKADTEFDSSRVTRRSGCADEKPGARAESKDQDAMDLTSALPSSKLSSAPQERKRRSSKSSVAKELARLGGNTAATPDADSRNARRRRDTASIRVYLSHHLDDDMIKRQKKILAHLGIGAVESVSEATHFVANKFARTRNMLEAMAAGKPVVTNLWLESCRQACCIVDEKKYILRDAKKEREMGFSMPCSLSRARQSPLLEGKRVFITPSVKPSRELVAGIVRAAKGQTVERAGRSGMEDLLIISCEEDHAVCASFLEAGRQVFGAELVLNGIITQRLDYVSHRIFVDRAERTRSRARSTR